MDLEEKIQEIIGLLEELVKAKIAELSSESGVPLERIPTVVKKHIEKSILNDFINKITEAKMAELSSESGVPLERFPNFVKPLIENGVSHHVRQALDPEKVSFNNEDQDTEVFRYLEVSSGAWLNDSGEPDEVKEAITVTLPSIDQDPGIAGNDAAYIVN